MRFSSVKKNGSNKLCSDPWGNPSVHILARNKIDIRYGFIYKRSKGSWRMAIGLFM